MHIPQQSIDIHPRTLFNRALVFHGRPIMKRLMALLVSACFLTACSNDSSKNELKQILECSMAAKLVGQEDKIDLITVKANFVAAKNGDDLSQAEGQKMHDEIKAKWNLKSMSRHDQDKLLVSVYNSKVCVALHQGDPITTDDVPPEA